MIGLLGGLASTTATVANLKLFSIGSIDAAATATAIVIAFVANLLFKMGIVFTAADRLLWKPVLLGFSLLMAGVLIGLSVV